MVAKGVNTRQQLNNKRKELLKKIETTERVQWKSRYRNEFFKTERLYYAHIADNTSSKSVKSTYEGKIKKSHRREKGIKSYEKRVKKGTDALSKFTVEQRKEFAKKSVQTRLENRAKKLEWQGLTHGEKIRRGKEMARQRREKRREAGRKAYATRQMNEITRRLELSKTAIEILKQLLDPFGESNERNRHSEQNAEQVTTDLEELADIYLRYGQFASEKSLNKLMNNAEFLKILALKTNEYMPTESKIDYRPSSMQHKFMQIMLSSSNFRDVKNPYLAGTSYQDITTVGMGKTLSSSDWFKKQMRSDIDTVRNQRLYKQFEEFKVAFIKASDFAKSNFEQSKGKKINFEYKPGKKWV